MDAVEEIKGRLSIEDVVGRHVDLKRSGASYKALCPFHQEKTPSFYVTPSRNSYHCFGCGRGGDIFNFVMEMDKLAFPEALRRLSEQAGVTLPERDAAKPSLSKKLYEANQAAARFFQETLAKPQSKHVLRYLEKRGFDGQAIEMFELGYGPEGRNTLVQGLNAEGCDERVLLAAGLALQEDIGGASRDRFHARLMFPIRDRSGRVVGFGGRTLGDAQPKYLNSPQTEVFDKSNVLYGIDRAQDGIRQAGKAILVEGYLDAIRAHLSGYTHTVASLGTAVTAKQLTALNRLTGTAILALDPDPAGRSAAARAGLMALAEVARTRRRDSAGAEVLDLRIARLPEDRGDPDEIIRDQPEAWERALAESVPAFEFYFAETLASLDRSSDRWRQVAIDRLLPLIQQFAVSPGWQATWLEWLARETRVDAAILQRSMPSDRQQARRGSSNRRAAASDNIVTETTARAIGTNPEEGVQRSLLALLLKVMIIPVHSLEHLHSRLLQSEHHQMILDYLLKWQGSASYDYETFRNALPKEVREEADELREMDVPLPDEGKVSVAIDLHLTRLRRLRLQAQQARASQLLSDLEPEDQTAAMANLAQLLSEQHQIEQSLERLSQQVLQA